MRETAETAESAESLFIPGKLILDVFNPDASLALPLHVFPIFREPLYPNMLPQDQAVQFIDLVTGEIRWLDFDGSGNTQRRSYVHPESILLYPAEVMFINQKPVGPPLYDGAWDLERRVHVIVGFLTDRVFRLENGSDSVRSRYATFASFADEGWLY